MNKLDKFEKIVMILLLITCFVGLVGIVYFCHLIISEMSRIFGIIAAIIFIPLLSITFWGVLINIIYGKEESTV